MQMLVMPPLSSEDSSYGACHTVYVKDVTDVALVLHRCASALDQPWHVLNSQHRMIIVGQAESMLQWH